MQQKNEIEKLCNDVLDFGDLLIIAEKSHGKTETLKTLARTFKNMRTEEDQNVRVFIFEDFPKWINEFDALPYMIIRDNDVKETQHIIDVEQYFLRHERSYTVAKGNEIEEFLKENQSGIFLMAIRDIERSAFFIYSVVNYFYRKAYLRAYKNYSKHEKIVFIIEESQNVFDSSTISKKLFNRMRKIYSVARNLGLHFVMASQRLQDLNTKIRGRTRLLIGQINLDDYELKIRRLLRTNKYQKDVLHLPKGVFLYPKLEDLISFPRFKQSGKPYEYKPKSKIKPKVEQPKPKTLKQKISNFLFPKTEIEPQYYNVYGDTEEDEEDAWTEEEEDLWNL